MPLDKLQLYQCRGLDRPEICSAEVLSAMAGIPRHEFVPEHLLQSAYDDNALPIGFGQTISQPFIVALMTQAARIRPGAKVLEIGTGSGYQAAVLSKLGAKVFSIEICKELAEQARERLSRLGFAEIEIRQGDGFNGWSEEAPFEAILITASSPIVPPELLAELADDGCLIIPLEHKRMSGETLTLFQRKDGEVISKSLGEVKFVPLVGKVRKRNLTNSK